MAGATEYFSLEASSSQLFQALYPLICRDLGENPVGTSKHQAKILEAVANSKAFSKKGPRVVLKRWFSWVSAGNFP